MASQSFCWEWLVHGSACAVGKQSITWAAEQAGGREQTQGYQGMQEDRVSQMCYGLRAHWNI